MGFYIKQDGGHREVKTRQEYKRIKREGQVQPAQTAKRARAPRFERPRAAEEVDVAGQQPQGAKLCPCGCGQPVTSNHPKAKYASTQCRRRMEYQRRLERTGRP